MAGTGASSNLSQHTTFCISEVDIGGELSKNDERGDVECVGARFIAPVGWGGANALHFATNIEVA